MSFYPKNWQVASEHKCGSRYTDYFELREQANAYAAYLESQSYIVSVAVTAVNEFNRHYPPAGMPELG